MYRNGFRPNVLVTGGTGDIGSAIAKKFHESGCNVGIHYYSSLENAEAFANELGEGIGDGNVRIFGADFSDPYATERMMDEVLSEMGHIDILVNNAGTGRQRLITDVDYEEWRRLFSINVDSMFICSKAVIPDMVRRRKGRIINISSIWGITGASCEVDYSASKAAMIGFTKALAKELGPSGITVNCVAPGVIDTKMNAHLSDEELACLAEEAPLGRLGTPEDIAAAVFFLASDEASFITGQVLSPNGGFVI